MSDNFHSSIVAPSGIWWQPAHKQEKRWIIISFIWCLILFAMMPLWHIKGGQNPAGIRAKVEPADFVNRVNRFIDEYKVGEENGFPVVEPPPGSEIYLLGRIWSWTPVLKLKKKR